MNEIVTITKELIEAGASNQGGWNRKQFQALGIQWPPKNGWKTRLIGTRIDRSKAALFLSLKGATKKPRKVRGAALIRSELPFSQDTGEAEKRVVDSFWRWLAGQPMEVRAQLREPLGYLVMKNNTDCRNDGF